MYAITVQPASRAYVPISLRPRGSWYIYHIRHLSRLIINSPPHRTSANTELSTHDYSSHLLLLVCVESRLAGQLLGGAGVAQLDAPERELPDRERDHQQRRAEQPGEQQRQHRQAGQQPPAPLARVEAALLLAAVILVPVQSHNIIPYQGRVRALSRRHRMLTAGESQSIHHLRYCGHTRFLDNLVRASDRVRIFVEWAEAVLGDHLHTRASEKVPGGVVGRVRASPNLS